MFVGRQQKKRRGRASSRFGHLCLLHFDTYPSSGCRRKDARTLFDAVETICRNVRQHLSCSRRPGDLHSLGLTMIAEAEMEPQIASRQITPSTPYFIHLRQITGDDLRPRIQRHLVWTLAPR